ncbi:cysteine synthase A [Salinicoccus luteus]|uniref:cysteine synthase A n=1 Tax=Salinicoccus luteus TaxID=367840 RepID=UPI0004E1EFBF|nr:cysteine synthase A [Salinicoccus luteus]
MSKLYNSITEVIGNTPLVKLNNLTDDSMADIYVKLEFMNPGSSVKDRIALSMIERAEEEGVLNEDTTIIEPTSGNTGIGLAMVAASRGYKTILVMPDTMSKERRNLLKAYGAELILTPGAEGMKGAIKKAEELVEKHGYFMPQQFENMANPEIHEKTTGRELVEQTEGLDVAGFVSGIGTGGTISGAGKVLKEAYPDLTIYAVEPKDSPVLSGGDPGPHKLQGLGAGFVPKTLNTEIYDEVIQIGNEEAMEWARELAAKEGILGGISSGAAVLASLEVAKKLGKGKSVITVLPSNGERYLSTPLFNFED